MRFTGIARPEEFRTVTRAHIIAWRDDLVRRALDGSTIRHRLASRVQADRKRSSALQLIVFTSNFISPTVRLMLL